MPSTEGTPAFLKLMSWLRRYKALVVLGCLLIGLLLAFTGCQWICLSEASQKRALLETSVADLRAQITARDATRPVFRGPAEAGNAWDDYGAALAEAGSLESHHRKLQWIIFRTGTPNLEEISSFLAAHPGPVRSWQRGVRREQARYAAPNPDWIPRRLAHPLMLGWIVQAQAWVLSRTEREEEAAICLIEFLSWMRDLHEAGFQEDVHENHPNGYFGALDLLKSIIERGSAEAAGLRVLEEGLAFIDRTFPSHRRWVQDNCLTKCRALLPDARRHYVADLDGEAWRFYFCRPLMVAGAVEDLLAMLPRVQDAENWSWSEEVRRFGELKAEVAGRNPRMGWPFPQSYALRLRLAQVRLLRLAVHYRRTGQVMELDDPFGGKLRSSKSNSGLKVWSIGRDAKDDSGVGRFDHQVMRPAKDPGPDIVLEIPR